MKVPKGSHKNTVSYGASYFRCSQDMKQSQVVLNFKDNQSFVTGFRFAWPGK